MKYFDYFLGTACMGGVGVMIGLFLGMPEGMGIIFAISMATQYIVNEIRNLK